jgi:hypothetical protein
VKMGIFVVLVAVSVSGCVSSRRYWRDLEEMRIQGRERELYWRRAFRECMEEASR